MQTLITLLHSDNRKQLIAIVAAVIVLTASYTGTLPALLERHKDVIQYLAYLVGGLGLFKMDPKQELK